MNTTLLNHLQELRSRAAFYFLFLVLFSLIGYVVRDTLVDIVLWPIKQSLVYTSPAGGFNFVLTLSLVFGFIFSLPLLLFQVLAFIKPAFPEKVKRIKTFVTWSFILVLLGTIFSYFVALPASLFFLQKLAPSNLTALITTDEYISFVTRYLLGFSLLFQLPLIVFFVNGIVKVSAKKMAQYQKWVILGAFLFAAILTPTPDVINQLIMAVPIIILYQVSVLAVYITNKRR